MKSRARLIRWDRSGAIVTEEIKYDEEPYLAQFFRRYYKAPPHIRGVDSTVVLLNDDGDEYSSARTALGLDLGIPLVKISVPCLNKPEQWFITGAPTAAAYIPPERSTRGFVAYDVSRNKAVYLKDTWRVEQAGIEIEGDIYHLLAEHNVPHIAHCLAAGDIADHSTHTHEHGECNWACSTTPFIRRRHYRLVLDVVGNLLTNFSSSFEMVRAV